MGPSATGNRTRFTQRRRLESEATDSLALYNLIGQQLSLRNASLSMAAKPHVESFDATSHQGRDPLPTLAAEASTYYS
jgi:hypothetical protein